jgi:hypothetical protein
VVVGVAREGVDGRRYCFEAFRARPERTGRPRV